MGDKIPIQLMKLFCNRIDVHAKQYLDKNTNKKGFSCEKQVTTLDLLNKHLNQEYHIGVYQLDTENKIKWICFDFDEDTKEDFESAEKLYFKLKAKEFNPLMEKSGGGNSSNGVSFFPR